MSTNRLFMVLACISMEFLLGCVIRIQKKSVDEPAAPAAGSTSSSGSTAPIAPPGRMLHNGMPKNGITVETLSANSELLQRLRTSALNNLKLDDVKPFSPLDTSAEPFAVQLMDYIISFALDEDQKVTASVGGKQYEWRGQMGACAKNSPLGDWFTSLPTEECQQAVSASVLARVNALNKVVVLSMRGPGGLIALQDKVPVETTSREKDAAGKATLIESFTPCAGGGEPAQATSVCGWSARYVGQCLAQRAGEPGPRKVTLKLRSAQATSFPVNVRVCQGIHGCNPSDYDAADPRSRYIKHITSASLNGPDATVTFDCPQNGPVEYTEGGSPVLESYGYFSVMLSRRDFSVDVGFEGSEGVKYPAKEAEVFRFREGGFYGNIFAPDAAGQPGSKVLFDDQYACFGEQWTLAAASLADRLCALPASSAAGQCFVNTPVPCSPPGGQPDGCQHSGDAKSLVYTPCAAAGSSWSHPITVYLNHPCDLRSGCSSLAAWPNTGSRK